MRITIDCGSSKPLPIRYYGGTQRVLWDLASALHQMGHQIILLAAPGSQCPFAERIIIRDPKIPIENQIPEDTDVVHFQNTVVREMPIPKPYIVTMHGNVRENTEMDRNTVFVSKNHAQRYGATAFVPNGLDWDRYSDCPLSRSRDYYHFLGKGSFPVKNLSGTLNLFRRVPHEKLAVMGAHRIGLKKPFRITLSRQFTFHGMVDDFQKGQILSRSKGLIFWVRWHEPFGLALTESLYMGCPVFGSCYGSLPEIVIPEVGYLSNSGSELLSHLHDFESPTVPQRCRDYAVEYFHARVMARKYLAYYEQVLSGQPLNDHNPISAENGKQLLPLTLE